jgi:hypothetical protein
MPSFYVMIPVFQGPVRQQLLPEACYAPSSDFDILLRSTSTLPLPTSTYFSPLAATRPHTAPWGHVFWRLHPPCLFPGYRLRDHRLPFPISLQSRSSVCFLHAFPIVVR